MDGASGRCCNAMRRERGAVVTTEALGIAKGPVPCPPPGGPGNDLDTTASHPKSVQPIIETPSPISLGTAQTVLALIVIAAVKVQITAEAHFLKLVKADLGIPLIGI